MTIYTDDCEMSKEVARAVRVLVPATAFFMSNLARIVDVTQLSVGDDDYDFFIAVPADRLHEMDLRIVDLKCTVEERFGVNITIMPIPVAAS
jgi:hypothetical protein